MGEEEIDVFSVEDEDPDEAGTIYRTYRMDFQNRRIIGMVDGLEAAGQGMFKAMQTRRYAYQIYDDQYGCDIMNKIGNADLSQEYFESDIPAMIEDAFLNMDEITGIDDLAFDIVSGDSVHISFSAATIFGDTTLEGDIDDG